MLYKKWFRVTQANIKAGAVLLQCNLKIFLASAQKGVVAIIY